MEKTFAKIISTVFYPLLYPFWFVLIAVNLPFYFSFIIPEKARWLIIILTGLTTFVIPMALILIFGFGMKKLVKPDRREERYLPYAIAAIFNFLTYYLLTQVQLSPIFNLFNLGATTLLILMLLITTVWRISIFTTAAGAFFGAFLGISVTLGVNMNFILFTVLILSGFIGYARLRLYKHTPAQVYSGFLLGGVVMFLHYYYL
jgi:membrane-associated HD superfamily phosphohydrolase